MTDFVLLLQVEDREWNCGHGDEGDGSASQSYCRSSDIFNLGGDE